MRVRIPVLLLPALIACQDYEIKDHNEVIGGTDDGSAPDIEVTPTLVDFGEVEVGTDVSPVETVTVANIGDAPLQISRYDLEDDTAPFSLSAIGTVLVEPGGSTTFTVTFEPLTAEDSSTRILIASDDPDEPEVPVDLTGNGLAPVISVSPETYDFGNPWVGCDASLPIEIGNIGNDDLVIDDFSYVTASNDISFDHDEAINGPLPWTVGPGQYYTVYVNYSPLDEYIDEGFLTVASNDPYRPEAQAYQSGTATVFGDNLDTFEQPQQGYSDILFVVDNSCSMAEEQTNLSNNFAVFAAGLASLEVDYQLAVITTDSPTFRGDILTPDYSGLEAEFIRQATPGVGGSGNEMPTEMAYQSTQSGSDAGEGGDFLRDDALFSMIFVSDEPDSSPNSWSDYLAHFQSLKDDTDNYVAHAISGDWPTGCSNASATNNVYELTVATGGLYLSVCATDWASHLEALVEGSTQVLDSFELTQWPVPETIVVRVDGITTSTGWTYNSVDNTVDFDENSIPEGGSIIEIEYAVYGECTG